MKKGIVLLTMCMIIGFMLPSCEKEVYDVSPTMEAYYTESLTLPTVSTDSVKTFSNKVDGYVAQFPEAKLHRRYAQILENIKSASLRIVISIDTAWAGTDSIRF